MFFFFFPRLTWLFIYCGCSLLIVYVFSFLYNFACNSLACTIHLAVRKFSLGLCCKIWFACIAVPSFYGLSSVVFTFVKLQCFLISFFCPFYFPPRSYSFFGISFLIGPGHLSLKLDYFSFLYKLVKLFFLHCFN